MGDVAASDWRLRLARIATHFEAACRDPAQAQRTTLARILDQARGSVFAREHDLSQVRTWADYRAAVPLRSCDAFQPYVRRALDGEPGVLFADAPVFFGRTSGTTGESKYIGFPPAARDAVWNFVGPWLDRFSDDDLANGFMLTGRYHEDTSPAGVVVGSTSGFTRLVLRSVPWCGTVPSELYELADYEVRYHGFLRFLLTRPLRVLATPNPSTVLALLEQFRKNREPLTRYIGSGRLDPSYSSGSEAWSSARVPRPEIASRLDRLPDDPTLCDLWPQLSKVATWQDGGTALYLEKLQAAAPGALLLRAASGATEGSILTHGWATPEGCCPAMLASFFEFTSPDGDPGNTVLVESLERGQTVRLILTSDRGIYRCLTDDLYQVVGAHHATPRLRYVGRTTLTSSFTGEKLTEPQISAALGSIPSLRDVSGVQVAPVWDDPPRYALIIEPADDVAISSENESQLLTRFEDALRGQNEEYAYKRDSLRLAPPMLVVLERGEFARRRRERSNQSGRSDAQYKVQSLTTELFAPGTYRIRTLRGGGSKD